MIGYPRHAFGTLLLALLMLSPRLHADWQTRSWSHWQIDAKGAAVVFGVEQVELLRLRGSTDSAWLQQELTESVRFFDGDRECPLLRNEMAAGSRGGVRVRLRFDCAMVLREPRIAISVFLRAAANPLHYAEIDGDGMAHATALFTRSESSISLAAAAQPAGSAATLVRYVALGFHHILAGLDHVAFLLCMLLVSERLRSRILMISGFTLGHSLTLSLSVLDVVRVNSAAVEALIGFTVALLAVEVFIRAQHTRYAAALMIVVVFGLLLHAWYRPGDGLPPASLLALLFLTPAYLTLALRARAPDALHLGMTSVFGLIHGLGFASVLKALGLPAGQSGWALSGFNVGVELGQLALLALFSASIWLAATRLRAWSTSGRRLAASGLCALGVFWFVERSLL